MQVKVGSSLSASRIIETGVPQGSVLGPLLFTVYINDLPNIVKHRHVIMYADDVILFHSGKSKNAVEEALQRDLDNIAQWSTLNGLTISIQKTKAMMFCPPRLTEPDDLILSIGGEPIECVKSFKYLGLWLDPRLLWEDHTDKVYKKMSSRANLIARHHHSFNKQQLGVYCDSLVLPVLSYLLPVWGSICNTKWEAFDRIMMRMVKKVMLDESVRPTPKNLVDQFEKLNWFLATERRDECMLKYFFKHFVLNNPIQSMMQEMFTFRQTPGTDRVVRKERNLLIPRMRTVFGQSSFAYLVAKRWNELPSQIQNQPTLNDFTDKLNSYIVSTRQVHFMWNLI